MKPTENTDIAPGDFARVNRRSCLSSVMRTAAGIWGILLITFVPFLDSSATPQVAWTARYSFGTNSDARVFGIALDSARNLIVAGTSRNDQGNADYVTAKYTPAGSNLWTRRFDSGGADTVRGLVLDGEANVLITGTSATVKYGANGTEHWNIPYGGRSVAVDASNNVVVTGFSETDFATVKLTPQGSNVWVRTFDRIGRQDVSQAVAVDSAGNVCVAGIQVWTCFAPEACYYDFYLGQYDINGTLRWMVTPGLVGLSRMSEVVALKVDSQGNVILTGNGWGSYRKYYTAKFTSSGEILWRWYLPAFLGGVAALAINSDGESFLTGAVKVSGETYMVDGTYRVDAAGNTVWNREYAGPRLGDEWAQAIALETSGNVYVTGRSTGVGTSADWATIKYNSAGEEQWVVRSDGPVHRDDQATAIAVDNTGGIYVGGFTTTTNGIEMLVIKYVETPSIQIQNDQTVKLQFLGTPGQSYRFQATTNFSNWDDIGTAIADPLGLYQWVDTNSPVVPWKFYRTVTP